MIVMQTNLEIEFKSQIDQNTYLKLMQEFNLMDQTFTQINYYFDTPDDALKKQKITLRIRYKAGKYKLTSKTHHDYGTVEKHLNLTEDEAQKMLNEPFNAQMIGLDYEVRKIAELKTIRAKVSYKGGTLFFDKSLYYDNIDYEIEYEVLNKEEGLVIFNNFLKEHNLTYTPIISKSKRAINKSRMKS